METMEKDTLILGGKEFHSRFILGSGKFSLQLIRDVMQYGGSEIATIALRRANADSPENILDFLPEHLTLLPNTSGARNAEEAVRIARLSRELGCGDFVKIEVIPDAKYLLPDNAETIRATEILAKEGFHVLPYMYPDLIAARRLADAGAAAIMPLGAPIGSNKGLRTKDFIQILIDEIDLPVIVDAGIGAPSQACEGDGDGRCCRHGKHRRGNCGQLSHDGTRIQTRHRGWSCCISGKAGTCSGIWRRGIQSPHRLLTGLRRGSHA